MLVIMSNIQKQKTSFIPTAIKVAGLSVYLTITSLFIRRLQSLQNLPTTAHINAHIIHNPEVIEDVWGECITNFLLTGLPFMLVYLGLSTIQSDSQYHNPKKYHINKKAAGAFLSYLIASTLSTLIVYNTALFSPSEQALEIHHASRPFWQVLANIMLSCTILPMQTYVEEYIFRSDLAKSPTLMNLLLSSFIFTLVHMNNPEMAINNYAMLQYFLGSLNLGVYVYRYRSLDYAWGSHLANNIVYILFLSPQIATIPGVNLFTIKNIPPDCQLSHQTLTAVLGHALVNYYDTNTLPSNVLTNLK